MKTLHASIHGVRRIISAFGAHFSTIPVRLLISGAAPLPGAVGIPGVLANPIMHGRHPQDGTAGTMAGSVNWSDGEKAALFLDAANKSGARPLPFGAMDAALFLPRSAGFNPVQLLLLTVRP